MSYNWEKWNSWSGKRKLTEVDRAKDLRKIEKNLKKTYDAYVKAIEDAQEFAVNEIDRKAGLKIHKERLKGVTRFKQWLDSWMHKEL